jgi:hypothetical protein
MNEATKEHLKPLVLYLKEQGKSDQDIVNELSSSYNLSKDDSILIINSVKDSFSKEIKTYTNYRLFYYLIPIFLISTSIFIGWILLSITETWIFFAGGIYGIISGLFFLLSGLSIDRNLEEQYPKLRLKLRASFGILIFMISFGYPAYRLMEKKYQLKKDDFIIFNNMILADKPNIKYENKIAVSGNFNFEYYPQTFSLEGSQFKAAIYNKLLTLKKNDTVDIFLKINHKTNGYDKSFFSKNIDILNIKKDNSLLIDVSERNHFEKIRLENILVNLGVFYVLIFHFVSLQIKKLNKLKLQLNT